MTSYNVEFYDFNRSERTMTGPSWEIAVDAISALDAVVKAAKYADSEVSEFSCCDDSTIATAYAVEPGVFECHLYVDNTDTAFTLTA